MLNVALFFLVKAWLWNKLVTQLGVIQIDTCVVIPLSSSLSLKMWKIKRPLRLDLLVFGIPLRCFIRRPSLTHDKKLIPPFTRHDRPSFHMIMTNWCMLVVLGLTSILSKKNLFIHHTTKQLDNGLFPNKGATIKEL